MLLMQQGEYTAKNKILILLNRICLSMYIVVPAFRGVKFHVPFMTPAFKVVKIFLENL